ncbi:MAG TPA: SAM-dependent methyltransferase, partial [Thermaerobacter sp.]
GRTVWRQVREMLEILGFAGPRRPRRPARILEIGAGGGHLARDLLVAAREDGCGPDGLEYVIVDESRRLQQRQRELIAAAWPDAPVRWVPRVEQAGPVHVVLMNELMSAFPVHRLLRDEAGEWRELYVTLRDGRFTYQEGPVSEPRALRILREEQITPPPGHIVDVNVGAGDMLRAIAGVLAQRAFVVTIDYGGPASEVYRPGRPQGSLRGYYRQQRLDDPFARPGEQDITADLDFTYLQRLGRTLGLRDLGLLPQGAFLLNLGIEEEALALARRARQGDLAADLELQRVYALYAPEGLGEAFWVLVQARGFRWRAPRLAGLRRPWSVARSLAELFAAAGTP